MAQQTNLRLEATARTEFGKGAARRIRRAHQIPAVLYGHGTDPIHLTLPGHDTMMALKNPNAVLTIVVDGGAEELALAKDVQRDPIKPQIDHVDLIIVKRDEKVTVDIPVHVQGEAGPETNVIVENPTVALEVEALHIPEGLIVSVEGLAAGHQILAKDVELPSGAALAADPELLVVNIAAQVSEEAMEAELAEAEADAGIEHEATEGEETEPAEDGDPAADESPEG